MSRNCIFYFYKFSWKRKADLPAITKKQPFEKGPKAPKGLSATAAKEEINEEVSTIGQDFFISLLKKELLTSIILSSILKSLSMRHEIQILAQCKFRTGSFLGNSNSISKLNNFHFNNFRFSLTHSHFLSKKLRHNSYESWAENNHILCKLLTATCLHHRSSSNFVNVLVNASKSKSRNRFYSTCPFSWRTT